LCTELPFESAIALLTSLYNKTGEYQVKKTIWDLLFSDHLLDPNIILPILTIVLPSFRAIS
jgi:hypothetical protein